MDLVLWMLGGTYLFIAATVAVDTAARVLPLQPSLTAPGNRWITAIALLRVAICWPRYIDQLLDES